MRRCLLVLATVLAGCYSPTAAPAVVPPETIDPATIDAQIEQLNKATIQPALPNDIKGTSGAQIEPIADPAFREAEKPEAHEPIVEPKKEPVEIWYYVTKPCPHCDRLVADTKDSKEFVFRLAKPDDWSKAQEAAGNGYPMVRWQVDGRWTAQMFGWPGLSRFVQIWKASKKKVA